MVSSTARAKARPSWRCTECGWSAAKWVGRCGECQAWGTVTEAGPVGGAARSAVAVSPTVSAQPIASVDSQIARSRPTGVGELDRILGGGLVPGAVVLLAGEPGVGKSTLLLDVAARVAERGERVLYVTGEESAAQVRLRAERIGALRDDLLLAAESDLGAVLGHIEATDPAMLVVDSVQTIASDEVEGAAGGVSQVRQVAASLIAVAKQRHVPVLLVGHVTKDGGIAGPRVLEHLVDVVCTFEGDRHSRLRMVRAVKNRYGPTDEVGCFDLSDTGIAGLPDPSGLFLSQRARAEVGTCVTVTLDGQRPMAIEIQALIAPSGSPNARRASSGLDAARTSMTIAVLQARAGMPILGQDVYTATVGGARAAEPAVDAAVALALASASCGRPVRTGVVAIAEIGLTGQLRPTTGLERRLAEAARLGFTRAVVPAGSLDGVRVPPGLALLPAPHIIDAIELALERPADPHDPARPSPPRLVPVPSIDT